MYVHVCARALVLHALTGNADFICKDSFPTLGKMFCLSYYLVQLSLKFVELGEYYPVCSMNIPVGNSLAVKL